MAVVEKYKKYLRFEKNYSSHTEISYYTDVIQFQKFVQSHPSGTDLITADADIVRDWIVSLMDAKLSSVSVNRKLSSLKSFYRFLHKIGEIDKSPLKKITGPKGRKSMPSFVSDTDMSHVLEESFVDEFSQLRDRVIVELFYMTGIRRAELINLKNEDVDLILMTIKVLGKRNKQRLIPISASTKDLLENYLHCRNSTVLNQNNSFFVRENGKPVYPIMIYRIVNKALRWIPTLKKASPHVLRHSFATNMLNNSAGINSVKEILGHSSLASTEIYTHTSFEELKKIYNQAHPRA